MDIKGKDIFIKEIDSTLNNLKEVDNFLFDIFSCYKLPDDLKFNIRISLVEAVNNSIKHGNHLNKAKSVILVCIRLKNCLRFKVQDEGRGFHQQNFQLNAEQLLEPNGRGVFIIKNCCDNYYTFDNGRITQFDFKLPE